MNESVDDGNRGQVEPAADRSQGPPTAKPPTKAAARRRSPWYRRGIFWLLPLVALCLVAAATLQLMASEFDYATVNALTGLFLFVAVTSLLVGNALRRQTSPLVRFVPLAFFVVGIATAAALLRIERVGGELVPEFTWRWQPAVDETLEPLDTLGDRQANLEDTTPEDFPGFLGPDRHPWIPEPELATDWEAEPPRRLWERPIGAGWSGFAAVNGYAVTMEQRGPDELVTCYDIETGEPIWSHAITARHETLLGHVGPRSTPTIHDGLVYALGATGVLRCLDGASGEPVWQDDLLERISVTQEEDQRAIAWGRASSPLAAGDLVVVPLGGPLGGPYRSLIAYDARTGDVQWTAGDDQVSYASPALVTLMGREQILSLNENSVSGHDPETGEELWSYPWEGESNARANVSQAVAVDDTRVLLSKAYSGGGKLIRLAPAEDGESADFTATADWANERVLKTKFTNVIVRDGYVYALSDGILECVDVEDGTRVWKRGRYNQGQILGVGDVILVQAESGEVALAALEPEGFRELTRFPALDGQTWNNPCLYGDRLLVRNSERAACYVLPLADRDVADPVADR